MDEHVLPGSEAAERREAVGKRPPGREEGTPCRPDRRETDADRYRRRVAIRGRLRGVVLEDIASACPPADLTPAVPH